jgi:hypothetical protein
VAGDQLPSGPWSLWAGGDGRQVALEMRLPAGRTWREQDTPAALAARWTVASADGRHVVWGLTPADVASVAVTLSDGRVVSLATTDPAVAGVDMKVLAAQLPEGVTITAAEGLRPDGSVAVRADDVAASLEPVAGFDPAVRATVPVAAAGPAPSQPAPTETTEPTEPAG